MNPPFSIDIPERFWKKIYPSLPDYKQAAFLKQIEQMAEGSRSHSVNLKKMKGRPNIWEARLNGHYRMTLELYKGLIKIRNAGPHDILKHNP